ncbi:phosphopantetheine-binding protein [Paenibacillus pinihumi]|uniref:phosphopantetheine-binding protein n=1 Tax=Paenibacillus pinihumi TaxID=669462 RepID=UPI00055D0294
MSSIDIDFLQLLSRYLRKDINFLGRNTEIHMKALGLDSMTSIHLICDIEEKYEIEFPDEYLIDETFSSITTLWNITQSIKCRLP